MRKRWAIYLHSVLVHFTDVSYTGNEAYNVVDHVNKFPCDGAGTSGDEEQMKDVYEEVYIWCFLTLHWTEYMLVFRRNVRDYQANQCISNMCF